MHKDFQIGDKVEVIDIPKWLIHDLPEDDQLLILSCINKATRIKEVDKFGYIWLDFSLLKFQDKNGKCCINGPLFCITKEYLKFVDKSDE